MKKRIFLPLLCLLLSLCPFSFLHVNAADISAKAGVVISADTGNTVYEKNASARLPMASTTKIMTALVALEKSSPDEVVTVAPEAAGIEGSSIYLFAGEKIKMDTLLYALLLESANDAAAAIAIHIAGSIEAFADMMNEKAAELGLTDTHFTNPHGLYDESHYTSAYDLAKLAVKALENEKFREIVSTYKKSVPMEAGGAARLFVNHNKLLRTYEGAIGVKTGYTKKSGRCLVSAAERDGIRFVAVTLSAPDDWRDHAAMLDLAFASYERTLLARSKELSFTLPVIGGELPFVQCTNTDEAYAIVKKGGKNVTCKIELPRFLFAEIKKGDALGSAIFYNNGKQVAKVPLTASFDVPRVTYKKGFFGIFG